MNQIKTSFQHYSSPYTESENMRRQKRERNNRVSDPPLSSCRISSVTVTLTDRGFCTWIKHIYFSSVGLRDLKKCHYRQQRCILAFMVHCGNVLSVSVMWFLSSALTSELKSWLRQSYWLTHVWTFSCTNYNLSISVKLQKKRKKHKIYNEFKPHE